ncbi:MAG: hypothetical protein ABIN18_14380 [Pseudomonadota bacterium]
MQVLKRRTKEYPLYLIPRVLKKRTPLSLVPKKEVIIPEVVKHSSLATTLTQNYKILTKQINAHPRTKLFDGFITPSIAEIWSRNKMGDHKLPEPIYREYKKSHITIMEERIVTYDVGVFLAVLKLTDIYKRYRWFSDLKVICKAMHLKSTSLDSQNAAKRSLIKWTDVRLSIYQYDKRENIREMISTSYTNVLAAKFFEGSNKVEIIISPFFIEAMETDRFTYIDTEFRAKLSSDTARHAYVFLARQQCFYNNPYLYACKFETFTNYTALPKRKYLSLTRQIVKRDLDELKDKGYVSRWELTNKDYLMISGVPKTKAKKIEGPTIKDDYPDITKSFRNQYIRRWRNGDENLGIDEENCMVQAAKRYMEEVLPDWKRNDVDSRGVRHKPQWGVGDVFDAIEASNRSEQYPMHAGWLITDKTIYERIPQYFRYEARKINQI